MFGILVSAFNVLLSYVLRSVIIKFVLYFGMYFFVTETITYLQSQHILPSASSLQVFGSIGSGTWYFLDLFAFSVGAPMIVTALVARFIIRRLPFIG
ncbi:DUF2523 family protein [Caballeronia sp. AZ7_KS35]|uniref:DUF2523 family protein n=1 Tax=Caballeronia sp. AZ7_KS35 TaxID=2921762 RepID=UPI002027BB2A|nr:DUF2523 family protein [Caballeronia sp. AZ7_KS35]